MSEKYFVLDTPLEELNLWPELKAEANRRGIKTMRELLEQMPYWEIRKKIFRWDSDARQFIDFLIAFDCFWLLNLSDKPAEF